MARIGLIGGFTPLPEGMYVFKVEKVEYKEQFGKLSIAFVTKDGRKHVEQFSLLDSKGKPNEGACNAFSFLAKTILDNFDLDEIDDQDLVGHYIKCGIEHQVVEKDGKTRTYAHLTREKEVAYGFDGEDAPAPESPEDKTPAMSADDILKSLGL